MFWCRLLSIHSGRTTHVKSDPITSRSLISSSPALCSLSPSQHSRIRPRSRTRHVLGIRKKSPRLCLESTESRAMTNCAPHELALVFPPMTESEFAALKEDIREHGQHEPITLYEGKMLDGLHRYRACQELGRGARVLRFEGNQLAAGERGRGRRIHIQ